MSSKNNCLQKSSEKNNIFLRKLDMSKKFIFLIGLSLKVKYFPNYDIWYKSKTKFEIKRLRASK